MFHEKLESFFPSQGPRWWKYGVDLRRWWQPRFDDDRWGRRQIIAAVSNSEFFFTPLVFPFRLSFYCRLTCSSHSLFVCSISLFISAFSTSSSFRTSLYIFTPHHFLFLPSYLFFYARSLNPTPLFFFHFSLPSIYLSALFVCLIPRRERPALSLPSQAQTESWCEGGGEGVDAAIKLSEIIILPAITPGSSLHPAAIRRDSMTLTSA